MTDGVSRIIQNILVPKGADIFELKGTGGNSLRISLEEFKQITTFDLEAKYPGADITTHVHTVKRTARIEPKVSIKVCKKKNVGKEEMTKDG